MSIVRQMSTTSTDDSVGTLVGSGSSLKSPSDTSFYLSDELLIKLRSCSGGNNNNNNEKNLTVVPIDKEAPSYDK